MTVPRWAIALKLGIEHRAIRKTDDQARRDAIVKRKKPKKERVAKYKHRKYTPEEIARFEELAARGLNSREIQELTGLPRSFINNRLTEFWRRKQR